jgi:ubiquinone/menaquinone biosynthesis C-methylase UbiE
VLLVGRDVSMGWLVEAWAERKPEAVGLPDPDTLLQEQIDYYRARVPEYDDWWLRTGRYEPDDDFGRRWEAGKRELDEALWAFAPAGQVLEIAAGTGNLTVSLAAVAGVEHITAVDTSEQALAIARTKIADAAPVAFVQADVFRWRPAQQFDVVAFGFWISHVPPRRFESFWRLVGEALRPGGRVFFTDNAVPVEQAATADGRQTATPWSRTWLDQGVSVRTLADGRRFHIIKRAWSPAELEHQLATLGWSSTVREHQGLFIHGEATPQAVP